jgi:hypothetical protein
MTTRAFSSHISMASSANMRIWGAELNAELTAAGLTQTTDTGQVNWTTAVLPSNGGTTIGYEIWKFNDTLQTTAPIFIKIIYAGGSIQTYWPGISFQVGTGSNGSGTLTGTVDTLASANVYGTVASNTTAYPTYICYNATTGFFGIAYKIGSGIPGFFSVQRTVDSSAAPTADGCFVYSATYSSASNQGAAITMGWMHGIRFAATASTQTSHQSFCFVPSAVTSSVLTNGNKQIYPHLGTLPEIWLIHGIGTVLVSEYPAANTFSTTIVGSSSATYLSLGTTVGNGAINNSANYCMAMLWQ